jgi:ELWxxDGT repeat protein
VFDGASVVPIDLRTGGDSWPQGIVSLGNVALTSATNAASWSVLWAIDPVAETGVELTINPVNYWMSIQAPAIAAGDTAFFTIDDELWTTDGTPGGTSVVEPVGRIDGNIAVLRAGDGAVKPLVLLFARDSSSGLISPWVSDGTPAGTSLLPVGLAFEDNGDLGGMVRAGSRVLFVGQVSGSEYAELFVTDGTVLGTSQLTDRAGGGDFDSAYQPQILSAVNGSWLYTDTQTSTGTELWVTDGATTELIEITPGATSSLRGAGGDGAATVLGDRVVFSAFTPAAGAELWASDGSADGTELLGEVLPGPAGQWVRPVATGDRVYFAAVGPEGDGEELWMWASPAPPQLSAAGSSPGIVSTAGPLQVEVVVTDDDGGLPSTIRARSAGAWHTMTAAVGCGALCDAGNGERFVGVLSQVAAGVSTTFELEVSDGVSTESLATAGPSFVSQPGDANGDGTLDAGDLARVVGELADSNSSSSVGDVRTGSLTGTWGGVDASPDLVLDAADASAAAARAF